MRLPNVTVLWVPAAAWWHGLAQNHKIRTKFNNFYLKVVLDWSVHYFQLIVMLSTHLDDTVDDQVDDDIDDKEGEYGGGYTHLIIQSTNTDTSVYLDNTNFSSITVIRSNQGWVPKAYKIL